MEHVGAHVATADDVVVARHRYAGEELVVGPGPGRVRHGHGDTGGTVQTDDPARVQRLRERDRGGRNRNDAERLRDNAES